MTNASFNVDDVSTWTYRGLRDFLQIGSTRNRRKKSFYCTFYGWTDAEWSEAKNYIMARLTACFDPTITNMRYPLQLAALRDHPELFVDRHGPRPPEWFATSLNASTPSAGSAYDTKCVLQSFISMANSHRGKRSKQDARDDEDEDEEEGRSLLKRQRTTLTRDSTVSRFGTMPSSPPTTAPSSFGEDIKPLSMVATTLKAVASVEFPGLILYITRVAIIDYHLVLTRDRFAFVNNLFENNKLSEPLLQELVFGNPLDVKTTHLYFFDPVAATEEDAGILRIIRNRPSAEVAIKTLQCSAAATATGIQIFDAADKEHLALVPVHEIKRQRNFQEVVKFEVEVDNGEEENADTKPGLEETLQLDPEVDEEVIVVEVSPGPSDRRQEVVTRDTTTAPAEQRQTTAPPVDQTKENARPRLGAPLHYGFVPRQKSDSESESEEEEEVKIYHYRY